MGRDGNWKLAELRCISAINNIFILAHTNYIMELMLKEIAI